MFSFLYICFCTVNKKTVQHEFVFHLTSNSHHLMYLMIEIICILYNVIFIIYRDEIPVFIDYILTYYSRLLCILLYGVTGRCGVSHDFHETVEEIVILVLMGVDANIINLKSGIING